MGNPVFDRIDKESQQRYAGFGQQQGYGYQQGQQAQQPYGYQQAPYAQQQYGQQPVTPYGVPERGVTLDDVLVKAGLLFGIVLVMAAAGWYMESTLGLGMIAWGAGVVGTLVLGLVISFMKSVSPPLIVLYAICEGLFVGAVSSSYTLGFDKPGTPIFQGIVAQAILGTLAVFAGMLGAYKFGLIKVTDKFRRIVTLMVIGYAIFALINLGYSLLAHAPFGIGGNGGLGMLISFFAIGLAAVTLTLDFDSIERAVATGAPKQYSWLLAHGLVVTIVWLYVEILRLLGRFSSR